MTYNMSGHYSNPAPIVPGMTSKLAARSFGWVPDMPDHRDFQLAVGGPLQAALPTAATVDAKALPAVWDQGPIGSCVGHACAALHEFTRRHNRGAGRDPSRLFTYYEARKATNPAWVSADTGASIRGGMKALAQAGVPTEKSWPYLPAKVTVKPPQVAYNEADDYQAVVYWRVPQTAEAVKASVAGGWPVVFGFTVYESFMTPTVARTGVVPYPAGGERVVGGHAVMIVGYDDARRAFRIRNSWGKGWGLSGHCWMPYEYVLAGGLASDFWTLRTVEA